MRPVDDDFTAEASELAGRYHSHRARHRERMSGRDKVGRRKIRGRVETIGIEHEGWRPVDEVGNAGPYPIDAEPVRRTQETWPETVRQLRARAVARPHKERAVSVGAVSVHRAE